jgi:Protein of unknown function (DUF1566)
MDYSSEWFPRIARRIALVLWIGAAWHAQADAPPDRYMINSSQGFVTDLRTGLIWQQPIRSEQYTWDSANTYCRGLSLGSMSGFRIPSLKELMTLVDPARGRPAIDPKAFPVTPLEWFWTSSNRSPLGTATVSFETGGTGYFSGSNRLRVRCVR